MSTSNVARAEFVHRRGEGLRSSVTYAMQNDWLFSDRGLTNALELRWDGPELAGQQAPFGALLGVGSFLLRPLGTTLEVGQVGVVFGQWMYTPGRFWDSRLLRSDQPFAGWLFGGGQMRLVGTHDTVVFRLVGGPLGPLSMAEQAQTLIHRFVIPWAPQPRGWRYQTAAGVGVMASAQWDHSWIVVDGEHWRFFDLRSSGLVRVGSVITSAAIGGEVRLGLMGRHRSVGGLDPRVVEAVLGSGLTASVVDAALHDSEAWLYASFTPRVVAWHAMIAGTPFVRNVHSVDFNRTGVALEAGLVAQVWIVRGFAGLVISTPEAYVRRDDGQVHWRVGGNVLW